MRFSDVIVSGRFSAVMESIEDAVHFGSHCAKDIGREARRGAIIPGGGLCCHVKSSIA